MKYTYHHYDEITSNSGYSGAEVARLILDHHNCSDVTIGTIPGELTDCYDPVTNTLFLSTNVYYGETISAIGIAAHECGHAIQKKEGYTPFVVRGALIPVVNFTSKISYPLVFIGLALMLSFSADITTNAGSIFITLGLLLYLVSVLFHLITIFIEINASRRAMKILDEMCIVSKNEYSSIKKILGAAALTYIAALALSIAKFLRLFLFSKRRK